MFTKSFAAALLAALPVAVNAVGSAIVKNECYHTIYLWSVNQDVPGSGPMHTLAPGETYSEPYKALNAAGVSLKLSRETDLYSVGAQAPIAQFEYTLTDMVWYDISYINGNPFLKWGVDLTPSDASCPAKSCAPGEVVCTDAYMQPDDNAATAACSTDADTTLTLCSNRHGQIKRDSMHKRAAHRHHFHRHAANST